MEHGVKKWMEHGTWGKKISGTWNMAYQVRTWNIGHENIFFANTL
mgnify:CR=1 FL=1